MGGLGPVVVLVLVLVLAPFLVETLALAGAASGLGIVRVPFA